MKHSILRKLMLIAVLLTGLHAFAHDFEVGGIYYNILSSTDKTVEVTYRGDSYYSYKNEYFDNVIIPENVTYNGSTYSVTSIGDYAFADCSGLTSVTIPRSVTSIGYGAFAFCNGLTNIKVETGNKKYDSRDNCNALIETATNKLIQGCNSTIIPNSVTSIGDYAFASCSGLTSITIPNSVTSIGTGAFSSCSGLTSVTIPNSVTSIGDGALSGCSGLTNIKVETGNKKYDSRDNCNAIIETATNKLIQGCNSTIIPSSVTSIGENAFISCTGLTSVTIPNSVTSIGTGAFASCSGLTSVAIPSSVTSIGDYAFYDCGSLSSVAIPNSVTSIGGGAFCRCTGLTSITIPNSVTSIGNFAFEGCSGLTSITISSLVTSIGDYAFISCSGLTSVTIPNSVTSIGNSAFAFCSGLTSVTIPSSVTSIGDEAFYGCRGFNEIICKSVTPPTAYDNTYSNVPTTATLYVPTGSKEAYASAIGWNVFTNIVEMEFIEETTITIKDASNQGFLVIKHEVGKAFEFMAVPVAGCVVNAVLVNGEEIIADENGTYKIESVSDETIISVSYEIVPESGVNTLNSNNLKVYGYENNLTVSGTEYGDTISIYDLNGTLIQTHISTGLSNNISLNNNGIYIVKVNNKSFKVIL